MNKTLKIFLGIFITLIVLALSSGIEITIKPILDSIPMGVSSQVGILIISILLISKVSISEKSLLSLILSSFTACFFPSYHILNFLPVFIYFILLLLEICKTE